MFTNISIGKKVWTGFSMILVLLTGIALWSVIGIGTIVQDAEEVIDGNKLRGEMVQREVDHLNWANVVSSLLTDASVISLEVQTDPHKCAFGKWYYSDDRKHAEELVPELKTLLSDIEQHHNALHQSAVHIGEEFQQADLEMGNFLREAKTAHLSWTHIVKDAFVDETIQQINAVTDPHQCGFGKWYYSNEITQLRRTQSDFDDVMDAIEDPHRQLHGSLEQIQSLLDRGQRAAAVQYYLETTEQAANATLAAIDDVLTWHDGTVAGMHKAEEIFATEATPALKQVQRLLGEINSTVLNNVMTDDEMLSAASSTRTVVTLLSILGIATGLILAFFIGRSIVTLLTGLIDRLSVGSKQVGSASNQLSSTSQMLAQGASEQASGLEETSASLEEMASMARQNADNSGEANQLAKDARAAAGRGSEAMNRMKIAINEIKDSSDETAKIIKVIDEIAFQTNLLALNAAVEAARAGEAGKGFAVVAEEVRNLAQRSAEAAKTTNEMIENSQKNAENGVIITEDVDSALSEIGTGIQKVSELVNEIANASQEQAQGVDQINTAVSQMDQVTQQNAANAEEGSSASEQLNSQAGELDGMVCDLALMVGRTAAIQRTNGESRNAHVPLPQNNQPLRTIGTGSNSIVKSQKSQDVIPLKDDDFSDF